MTKIRHIVPLLMVELLLGGTFLLYRFGPWVFPYREDLLTTCYVIGLMLAFLVGYFLFLRLYRRTTPISETKVFKLPHKIALLFLILGAVLMIPYSYDRTGFWYPPLIQSLQNLGIAYAQSTQSIASLPWLHNLASLGRPFIFMIFMMTYYYWNDLPKAYRIVGLLESIWYACVEMATGHNRGIFSYCVMLVIMYFAVLCTNLTMTRKQILMRTICIIVAILVVSAYFAAAMQARSASTLAQMQATGMTPKEIEMNSTNHTELMVNQFGYQESEVIGTTETPGEPETLPTDKEAEQLQMSLSEKISLAAQGKISADVVDVFNAHKDAALALHPHAVDEYAYAYVDPDFPLFKILPDSLDVLLITGSSYVIQGYHGITLGLRQPFHCAMGAGTFIVFQDFLEQLFGTELYERTYVYTISQAGYPVSLKWGTAAVQWASDLSFPGVIVLMAVFGFASAYFWVVTVDRRKLTTLLVVVPLGYYLSMFNSWWMPGMAGSDFLFLHMVGLIWLVCTVYSHGKHRFGRKQMIIPTTEDNAKVVETIK